VPEQFHQCIDAHIRIGEFGGKGYLYLLLQKGLSPSILRRLTREAREGVYPG
jgi:hypothetical protein